MGGYNRSLIGNKSKNINELTDILKEKVEGELIYEKIRSGPGFVLTVLIFEEYFFRTASFAGLTLVLLETDDIQRADIIGSASGAGIFNISLGADKAIVCPVVDLLLNYGFRIDENEVVEDY